MVMKSIMRAKTGGDDHELRALGLYFACIEEEHDEGSFEDAMVRATMMFKPEKYLLSDLARKRQDGRSSVRRKS